MRPDEADHRAVRRNSGFRYLRLAQTAATHPATCSGAVDTNYSASYVAGTASVAKAPLVITANSVTMTFGGPVPSITADYAGFVNGDTAASLTAPPACSTAASGSSPPGTYSSSCSGAEDDNYDVSYVAGTVTVVAAPSSAPPGHDHHHDQDDAAGQDFPRCQYLVPERGHRSVRGQKLRLCRGKGLCRRELVGSNGKGRPRQDPGRPCGRRATRDCLPAPRHAAFHSTNQRPSHKSM